MPALILKIHKYVNNYIRLELFLSSVALIFANIFRTSIAMKLNFCDFYKLTSTCISMANQSKYIIDVFLPTRTMDVLLDS